MRHILLDLHILMPLQIMADAFVEFGVDAALPKREIICS